MLSCSQLSVGHRCRPIKTNRIIEDYGLSLLFSSNVDPVDNPLIQSPRKRSEPWRPTFDLTFHWLSFEEPNSTVRNDQWTGIIDRGHWIVTSP
jgi:hypothetical protein